MSPGFPSLAQSTSHPGQGQVDHSQGKVGRNPDGDAVDGSRQLVRDVLPLLGDEGRPDAELGQRRVDAGEEPVAKGAGVGARRGGRGWQCGRVGGVPRLPVQHQDGGDGRDQQQSREDQVPLGLAPPPDHAPPRATTATSVSGHGIDGLTAGRKSVAVGPAASRDTSAPDRQRISVPLH